MVRLYDEAKLAIQPGIARPETLGQSLSPPGEGEQITLVRTSIQTEHSLLDSDGPRHRNPRHKDYVLPISQASRPLRSRP